MIVHVPPNLGSFYVPPLLLCATKSLCSHPFSSISLVFFSFNYQDWTMQTCQPKGLRFPRILKKKKDPRFSYTLILGFNNPSEAQLCQKIRSWSKPFQKICGANGAAVGGMESLMGGLVVLIGVYTCIDMCLCTSERKKMRKIKEGVTDFELSDWLDRKATGAHKSTNHRDLCNDKWRPGVKLQID